MSASYFFTIFIAIIKIIISIVNQANNIIATILLSLVHIYLSSIITFTILIRQEHFVDIFSNVIINQHHHNSHQAGTATAVMTVSGLVGGVLYGSIVRRFGRQVMLKPYNYFNNPTF